MMNYKLAKTMAKTFTLFLGVVVALTAEAASVTGALGSSAVALDAWRFTCPTGTVQSRVRVMDNNGTLNTAATVFVSFGEDAAPTWFVSDTESTSTSSPWATNTSDGPGNYVLVVNKSAAGLEDYTVEAQCLDSSLVTVIGPSRIFAQVNE